MATIDIKLKTYEQLQFEIIKLNTDIVFKNKEIDRLNNIISELEKFCKDCIVNHQIARENGDYTISDTFFEMILDKLKKLKEKE